MQKNFKNRLIDELEVSIHHDDEMNSLCSIKQLNTAKILLKKSIEHYFQLIDESYHLNACNDPARITKIKCQLVFEMEQVFSMYDNYTSTLCNESIKQSLALRSHDADTDKYSFNLNEIDEIKAQNEWLKVEIEELKELINEKDKKLEKLEVKEVKHDGDDDAIFDLNNIQINTSDFGLLICALFMAIFLIYTILF